jgi:hypothetical protein
VVVAEGAVEPEEGAAVLERVLEPVAATVVVMLAVTVAAMLAVTVVATVVVMLAVTVAAMAAVTAAAMVTALLPARATATAGEATWWAPVVVQRSLHPAASIARVQQPGVSPVRRLVTLIRVVA